MTGLCIGIGGKWRVAAANAARRMEEMTGITCHVIDDARGVSVTNPSWLKCHIPRLSPTPGPWLVFDADIIPMKPWHPQGLWRGNFAAVPEVYTTYIRQECNAYGLDPRRYVNGGLFMCDESHQHIWDNVWKRHPRYGKWLEQTALNAVLLSHTIDLLPGTLNTLLKENEDKSVEAIKARPEVNLHYCGLGGNIDRLIELQDELWG